MAVTWISERVGYQGGPVNVGFVRLHGDQALVIDAGLDPDRARKVIRDLEDEGLRARALLLTHSHADHIGGAALLRRRCPLRVAAPTPEAGFIRFPSLEPFYLYGGAAAPGALTGKFLQAEGCAVDVEVDPGPWRLHDQAHRHAASRREPAARDEVAVALRLELLGLAGHSPGQVGLAVYEETAETPSVIFCGDAVFPADVWSKHGFVYFCDIDSSLDAIHRLGASPPGTLVAGHGVARGDAIQALLSANEDGLRQMADAVARVVEAHTDGVSAEELLTAVAEQRGARVGSPSDYFLARATVHAHLAYLEARGRVSMQVTGARLTWRPAEA
jgi:glyoxylase-like metal-dependent hydrolase (beta-lactamase superfamily II)